MLITAIKELKSKIILLCLLGLFSFISICPLFQHRTFRIGLDYQPLFGKGARALGGA